MKRKIGLANNSLKIDASEQFSLSSLNFQNPVTGNTRFIKANAVP